MASQIIPPVVAQYFTAIRRMDPDAWLACFTEQATSYEPGAPAPLQGRGAWPVSGGSSRSLPKHRS